MQNKGAIRLFAILLVLASIYSLSFTYYTRSIEKEAEELATDAETGELNLRKMNEFLDSMKSEPVYMFDFYTYSECKEKELNFGLDLKGGMNVTLEISVVDLIKTLSTDPNDSIVANTIERAKTLQESSTESFVTLFGKAFKELYPNERLATYFATLNNKDVINYDSSDDDVLAFLNKEAQSAIDNSFNILRTRIDRFGVTQPNIQSLGAGRILVELPGVKEPARVRKLLQGTAQLEFWETYEANEVYPYLEKANKIISDLEELKKEANANKTVKEASADNTEEVVAEEKVAEEKVDALDALLAEDTTDQADTTGALSLEDEMAADSTAEDTTVQAQNLALFSKLIITPDGKNLFSGPVAGISHIKDTAKVNEYLSLPQLKDVFPKNLRFMWTIKAFDDNKEFFQLVAIRVPKDGVAPLDGEVITNASLDYGQSGTRAGVSMRMNAEGAQIWARLTKENSSPIKRSIAIVLDNYVYSFPTVQGEITGGNSSITGNFTVNEARDLANVLKSGKLPAPARIIEEVVVGPSLGKEAISAGLWSFVIAFIFVLLYMMFYYKGAGYVANLALILNMFLIFGVLASLGAVLTLPGIAGIVLTIGMSVDANVLIYERIREEIGLGKGTKLAIADGYKNALSAIIDANVTTILTGIILYVFGSGPIQGFATTLIIGIVTSLFSAIFITRLVFERMLDKKKEPSFDTKLTRNAFRNLDINFIDKRKTWYVISALVIVAGIASMVLRQWNVGVDFKGGRTYVVRFDEPVSTVDIQNSLAADEIYGEAPDVKIYGQNNQVKITTEYLIDDKTPNADSIVESKLYDGLKPLIGEDTSLNKFLEDHRMSSQKVGPTFADDIVWSAVLSVIFSLLVIFLYIFIRFRNWQYGLGAVAALFHDVLIVLGLFSLFHGILPFSLEIGQSFIAAILTVIGYSINDTVVVFDRIREFAINFPKRDKKTLFNTALNSTMSRTFSTSLSTFVVLLAIFIFGGETIRGFIFAMMIGVVVGTYSSLFIASPVVFDSAKKKELTNG